MDCKTHSLKPIKELADLSEVGIPCITEGDHIIYACFTSDTSAITLLMSRTSPQFCYNMTESTLQADSSEVQYGSNSLKSDIKTLLS